MKFSRILTLLSANNIAFQGHNDGVDYSDIDYNKVCDELNCDQDDLLDVSYDELSSNHESDDEIICEEDDEIISDWTEYITQLEKVLMEHIELMYKPGVIFNLYKLLIKIDISFLCSSFPKGYFVKLFIRIRIYYIVLFINRTLNSKDKKARNNKLLKLTNEI